MVKKIKQSRRVCSKEQRGWPFPERMRYYGSKIKPNFMKNQAIG